MACRGQGPKSCALQRPLSSCGLPWMTKLAGTASELPSTFCVRRQRSCTSLLCTAREASYRGRERYRSTQLGGIIVPGVWASTSGVPANFQQRTLLHAPAGAGCRHCAVRAVRPSMALTDGGFDHARCQSAGRLPHPPSLSHPAVRVRHERTRGGSAWRSSRWTLGGSGPVPLPSQT